MEKNIVIRAAKPRDGDFIFSLSPYLANEAKLQWHSQAAIDKMQFNYITEMLTETVKLNATYIAEASGIPLGFIHVREHNDSISGENCGTVPLLAVSPSAQGMGVGKLLISSAESWSKEQGYRLLHLEVFSNNQKAKQFYQAVGFKAETEHMIKPL